MAKEVETKEVKKVRRGITNDVKAVSNLKFHEKDACNNGLFVGQLEEVKVEWSVPQEGKTFAGYKVPRLTFHYTSLHKDNNEKRHIYQTFNPVESNVSTIPGGKEAWKVDAVINWCKHILDVFYIKDKELTAEEEEGLILPFEDYDENGEFVEVPVQDVLNGYGVVFTNIANLLNGKDGKPCYKDNNGNGIKVWMKLLRAKKRNNKWENVVKSGDLSFDTFVGNGALELVKENRNPVILRLDGAKESITPKETTPTIGANNPMLGTTYVGANTEPSVSIPADIDEMPF